MRLIYPFSLTSECFSVRYGQADVANAIITFNHPLNKYLTPVSAKQAHPLFALRALSFYNATYTLKYMTGRIPKKTKPKKILWQKSHISHVSEAREHSHILKHCCWKKPEYFLFRTGRIRSTICCSKNPF